MAEVEVENSIKEAGARIMAEIEAENKIEAVQVLKLLKQLELNKPAGWRLSAKIKAIGAEKFKEQLIDAYRATFNSAMVNLELS